MLLITVKFEVPHTLVNNSVHTFVDIQKIITIR